jgi:hypothetical protein
LRWSRLKQWIEGIDGDWRAFAAGYLVLLPLYLAPLIIARYPPGLDLPFHLAIADMMGKDGQPGSPYAPFYDSAAGLHPYLLHYWALVLLGKVMPLMAAHKLCMGLYVAGLPLAASALLGACARSRIPALLGFPLAYNLTLHYGFFSFALSLPVLLALLAAVSRLLITERRALPWWIASAVAAFALFLCHLQNFLFGVCAMLVFVALSRARWQRRLHAVSALLPAVAAVLHWHFTTGYTGDVDGRWRTAGYLWASVRGNRLADMVAAGGLARDVWHHVTALPHHLLRGFFDGSDVRASEALLLVMAVYLLLGTMGVYAGRPSWEARPRLRAAGWLTLLGAAIAYLGLPHHLHQLQLSTLSPRFAVLIVLVGLLAIPGSLKNWGGPLRALLLAPALAVCALHGANLCRVYRLYDNEVADFSAVVQQAAPGKRALGLVFNRYSNVMAVESALVGLPSLYPALRPAPGSMVPLTYCDYRHLPCRSKPGPPPPGPGAFPWNPGAVKDGADKTVAFYDYLFVRHPPPGNPIFGEAVSQLELVARSGSWLLYGRRAAGAGSGP